MIPSTELILNADGSIYHLALLPEDIAHKIIFVGDPERIPQVTAHFDSILMKKAKREFHATTGIYKGQMLTVMSTGIGTDNIDIVMNELDALVNIDFASRTIKNELISLKIMRLGTCGGMQKELPVGTIVHSAYAVGADGLLTHYPSQNSAEIERMNDYLATAMPDFASASEYYIVKSEGFEALLQHPEIHKGITLTNKGFYGPQGRSLGRVKVAFPTLIDDFTDLRFPTDAGDLPILNLEMETAGILGLGGLLGHQCVSLSVILANRPLGIFAENPAQAVGNLIQTGLDLMLKW